MKNKVLALAILLFSLKTAIYAQAGSGKITGKVVNESAKIIESATVSLLKAADSTVVRFSLTDREGNYLFENVAEGEYLVSVSAVGYDAAYSGVFAAGAAVPVEVGPVSLAVQAKAIAGVTVTSRKPLIEQKLDRMVVNVEASITNAGGTALEVLEKSPGITVDKDGNISLKGKAGVVILIDGRPSYLGGADLANMLRSMSAAQLDQIEIMTNPPAKYDAAGNSGVINIKTKKNKQFGYNGSLTSTYAQGVYARFNESFNFNYRKNKVNLFSNLTYNRNHRAEDLYIDRNFREKNTEELTSILEQHSSMKNESHYFNAKLGADYSVSRKTTLGAVLNGYHNPAKWRSLTHSLIYNPDYELNGYTNAFAHNKTEWNHFSANLNARHVFDSTGQELMADLDYIQYRSTNTQPLYSYYFDNAHNPTQDADTLTGYLPQDITIYSAKTDYTKPLKNGAKFEAGVKFSYITTDNNAVYNNVADGIAILDSGISNHFVYKENINAAYVNYSRPLGKKWSGQFGLRLENTVAKGDSKGFAYSNTDEKFVPFAESFSRSYTQLFPTAYIQYAASENNQFVINYGRRINRPNYRDLNPFLNFLDRYTFEKGNPNLKPQFSHNIELQHIFKGFLSTTLNYSATNDIIQQVIEQDETTNETYIKKANIATRKQVGLAVSAQKQVTKWWTGILYANASSNYFKGIVNNEHFSANVLTFLVQAQQQFRFDKGWSAELSGLYRSKGLEGVIFIEDVIQVSAGLSKQVLKQKGTIRLNVRDIFGGSVFRGYSKYGNVDASFRNVNDNSGRAVTLSFSWRFSKGQLKAGNGRRNNSAADEQSRVTGGN